MQANLKMIQNNSLQLVDKDIKIVLAVFLIFKNIEGYLSILSRAVEGI